MEKKIIKTENIVFRCKEIPLTRRELKELFNFHIPCLCCGMEMLHPDIYTELLENPKLSGNAPEVVELLSPFENIMHPVERQVFNMFKSLGQKR